MPTNSKKESVVKTERVKNLLILESPLKAKTVQKYLGDDYQVISCKGHIRDLPESEFGVDIEKDFTPKYVISRKNGKTNIVKELKAAADNCDNVLLATDPDREGEAIAWHIAEALEIDKKRPIRVTFNEITKNTVLKCINEPRSIDEQLFYAQQARRVLDRIVGYKISPILWKKVKKGLSAGRVQSVATKMIVDREREIQAFVPKEFWNLDAVFESDKMAFSARFYGTKDKKVSLENKDAVDKVVKELDGADYLVSDIKKQEKQKSPRPPFTTSSLQQDAANYLNLRPTITMSIAQQLYEGINIKGKGLTGLITYMRTDSLRISDEAVFSARKFITETYGEKYVPQTKRVFKTRADAQDAHEAIRPTDVYLTPDSIKGSLTADQFKLYRLIWSRFVSSQMANAKYDVVSLDISANEYLFKATSSAVKFKGYTTLYSSDDGDLSTESKIPSKLEKGEALPLKKLVSEQKFTQPPTRYTEGSLVKTFEENGIGRPSTYATIVSTIQERGYIEKDGKFLIPTELGFITTDIMVEYFKDIVDVKFTAKMETELDEIAEGKMTYLDVMNTFYGPFKKELDNADKNMERIKIAPAVEVSDVPCELCGSMMVYKTSKFGRFLACPNFPTCKNTKSIVNYAKGNCPVCGKPMIAKTSKKGKTYFACEDSKGCNYMTWDTPVSDKCPDCGRTLFKKFSKLVCHGDGCTYEANIVKKRKNEKS